MLISRQLSALLIELKELLRDEEGEDLIVFRYDDDGVIIQERGHYYGTVNGITFIEIEEPL